MHGIVKFLLVCFALFLIVMLLYSIVFVNTIQYNAMHKFVGVSDFSPIPKGNLFCQNWYVKG